MRHRPLGEHNLTAAAVACVLSAGVAGPWRFPWQSTSVLHRSPRVVRVAREKALSLHGVQSGLLSADPLWPCCCGCLRPQAFVPIVQWSATGDVAGQVAHFAVVGEVGSAARHACRVSLPMLDVFGGKAAARRFLSGARVLQRLPHSRVDYPFFQPRLPLPLCLGRALLVPISPAAHTAIRCAECQSPATEPLAISRARRLPSPASRRNTTPTRRRRCSRYATTPHAHTLPDAAQAEVDGAPPQRQRCARRCNRAAHRADCVEGSGRPLGAHPAGPTPGAAHSAQVAPPATLLRWLNAPFALPCLPCRWRASVSVV